MSTKYHIQINIRVPTKLAQQIGYNWSWTDILPVCTFPKSTTGLGLLDIMQVLQNKAEIWDSDIKTCTSKKAGGSFEETLFSLGPSSIPHQLKTSKYTNLSVPLLPFHWLSPLCVRPFYLIASHHYNHLWWTTPTPIHFYHWSLSLFSSAKS